MASSKKIVVTSEIFIDNNDNNKEIIYSCEIEADKIKKDIIQEDFQFTYTGKHDHGEMPKLKEGAGIYNALKKAKEDSNVYLSKKVEEEKMKKKKDSQPKLKKQKLKKQYAYNTYVVYNYMFYC